MKSLMVPIAFALLFGMVVSAHAQDKHPMMTVDETVKWAKEKSLKSDQAVEPSSRLDPSAREELWSILADRDQRAAWCSVVYAFRFLGQSEDVPRIARWVEGFRGQSLAFDRAEEIIHAQNALGAMARRGVEGARPALEKMMVPDYWRGLSVTIASDDGVERLGGSFCYLAIRAAVSGAYTRDPDFKAKVRGRGVRL